MQVKGRKGLRMRTEASQSNKHALIRQGGGPGKDGGQGNVYIPIPNLYIFLLYNLLWTRKVDNEV